MEEEQNENDALDFESEENENEVSIRTHEKIEQNLSGEVLLMEKGYVETRLSTTYEMVADDVGLIHGGFIFSGADYAAMLAVNERNVVLVGSECQFLSPVKLHDEVKFIARVRHKEGKKRNVHVEAFVLDIKVFEGEFKTVVTERHVLRLKLLDEEGEKK
ncbi:PaaI family thioesterase [Sulfurimonas aquatica]|uniref:PaaI family thioesterase n=1 Tax=Sulfurimonas aquatica TaxID=2672570 RepID=A0A975GE46_9BACT|nr:PaaI family thioesterase [Sulfurimonas aquatica]